MDNRDTRSVWFLVLLLIIAVAFILWKITGFYWDTPIDKSLLTENGRVTITVTPSPEIDEGWGISISRAKPTDYISPTSTLEPTSTPTLTPTFAPTATPTLTPTVQPTPKPTNTPKPTARPTPSPTVDRGAYPKEKQVARGGHGWKPWARHTAITNKKSPQYKMQKNVAKTDPSNGLRYCIDPYGEKRYCVALGVYWCGGDPSDIGRCFDVVMANGATIKCCLGDTKRVEKSQKGEGKFGSKGELLEFQAEAAVLKKFIGGAGDVSNLGGAFEGEAVKIIVYNYFIPGFGGQEV